MSFKDIKNTDDYYERLKYAADYVKKTLGTAEIALVLGSGLNNFTEQLVNPKELSYSQIPYMPQTTVAGHAGKMVLGQIANKNIICLAGRSHSYEGYQMYQLTFTARLLALIGCKLLIATNAAGGSQKGMFPGCLMIITDHINCYRRNPLADTYDHDGLTQRHPTFSSLYSKRVTELAKKVAKDMEMPIFEGIYGATSGPCFETPAEVIGYSTLGASSFGMSTIPETMAAGSLGMEVFAMSLITNLAAGISTTELTHKEVMDVAKESAKNFEKYMKTLLTEVTPKEVQILKPAKRTTNSLPHPIAKPATRSQILEAASFFKSKFSQFKPNVAILLNDAHEKNFTTMLKSKTELVAYKSIPHFPAIGPSRDGSLMVGTTKNDKHVICFVNNAPEGFLCEEANFIMEVLAEYGVSLIIGTFVAGLPEQSGFKEGQRAFLVDCLDSTTVHSAPASLSLNQYALDIAPLSTKYLELARSFDKEIKEGKYLFYQGPSFPTPAELVSAKYTHCDLVGISALAPIYAARACNIDTIGLAEVLYVDPLNQIQSSNEFSALAIHIVENATPEVTPLPKFHDVSTQQASYLLATPIHQGNYDEVQEALTHIRKTFGNDKTAVGIVVDSEFVNIALKDKFEVIHQIEYKDIPHMNANYRGKLVHGKLDGTPVNVCFGNFYWNEGFTGADLTFGVRILHGLGMTKLFYLSPVVSGKGNISLGEIAFIRDHVTLSGRNPLFGQNEERWGVRFPDVTEAYSKSILQKLTAQATHMNLKSSSVVVGHFVGPIINSAVDFAFAKELGAEVLTTGIVPEVVTARHMQIAVAGIGIVSYSLQSPSSKLDSNAPVTLKSVDALLAQVIKSL